MRIEVVKGCIHYNGGVYTAGASVEVENSEALRLIDLNVAQAVTETVPEDEAEIPQPQAMEARPQNQPQPYNRPKGGRHK